MQKARRLFLKFPVYLCIKKTVMLKINSTNFTVMVKSLDDSIKFYESLGLTLQQRWDDHYAMVTAAGITLGLHPSDKTNHSSGTTSVGFMIDSLDEGEELLTRNGIKYQKDTGKSGAYLHFNDPDGTALYFVQPAW